MILLLCCMLTLGAGLAGAQTLAEPVRLQADGRPLAVEVGHAAPCVVDWNRDGRLDLLVGQFGEGKARLYLGAAAVAAGQAPRFGPHRWFRAGGEVATVPAG